MSVEGFAALREAQDAAALTRIPGVGRKTAERLLIEMRDRLDALGAVAAVARAAAERRAARPKARRASALVALGYKPAEVTQHAQAVRTAGGSPPKS